MNNNVNNEGLTEISRESFFGVFSNKISASERIRTICMMGVLIAVYVILERWVAIPIGNILRFSFTFIILYTSAVMLGLVNTVVIVTLADVIGSFIAGYAPNPFITLCLIMSAIVVSLLVHKKRSVPRFVFAVLFDQLISCLLVKSFVLAVMYYGSDQYFKVLASRAVQIGIMIPLQIVILLALNKFFFPRLKDIVNK